MNIPIEGVVSKIWSNKHTSLAATMYGAAKFGCPVLEAWFPAKKAALDVTAQYLEAAAVAYGFVMAGDAKATQPDPAAAPPAVSSTNKP